MSTCSSGSFDRSHFSPEKWYTKDLWLHSKPCSHWFSQVSGAKIWTNHPSPNQPLQKFLRPPLVSVPRQKGWRGEDCENPSLRDDVSKNSKQPQFRGNFFSKKMATPWTHWLLKKFATQQNRSLQPPFVWETYPIPTECKNVSLQ